MQEHPLGTRSIHGFEDRSDALVLGQTVHTNTMVLEGIKFLNVRNPFEFSYVTSSVTGLPTGWQLLLEQTHCPQLDRKLNKRAGQTIFL